MDKHFRLPASKKCVWKDCDSAVTPDDEMQIPFKGNTLLVSLCLACRKKLPASVKFQSFSGNGYRYVELVYPA